MPQSVEYTIQVARKGVSSLRLHNSVIARLRSSRGNLDASQKRAGMMVTWSRCQPALKHVILNEVKDLEKV